MKKDLNWLAEYLENADIRLLYMGPLIPERFPVQAIVPTILKLKAKGFRVKLIALTTIRNKRNLKYYNIVRGVLLKHKLEKDIIVRPRILLSDEEKASVLNSFDALIYVPLSAKEMADPPFTILEALSCGIPVIMSSIGDLAKLMDICQIGIVELIGYDPGGT